MVEIREARVEDGAAIAGLMTELGYPGTEPFIEARISELLGHDDAELLVAVDGGEVVGVISLHFIPQLALAGDFCRISYFCVSRAAQGRGIGGLLEAKAVEAARQRKCDRIELHCDQRRHAAHRYYSRKAYVESPKYLMKSVK